MSFWDTIKPTKTPPTVTGIQVAPDKRSVELAWDDGKTTRLTARRLRQICPCAACVDEWTNKLRHDPEKIPATTTVEQVVPVGNYALAFGFSDSHSTGIYTWELLRSASEESPGA